MSTEQPKKQVTGPQIDLFDINGEPTVESKIRTSEEIAADYYKIIGVPPHNLNTDEQIEALKYPEAHIAMLQKIAREEDKEELIKTNRRW